MKFKLIGFSFFILLGALVLDEASAQKLDRSCLKPGSKWACSASLYDGTVGAQWLILHGYRVNSPRVSGVFCGASAGEAFMKLETQGVRDQYGGYAYPCNEIQDAGRFIRVNLSGIGGPAVESVRAYFCKVPATPANSCWREPQDN